MKKLFLIAFLLLAQVAIASPITLTPSNAWQGENISLRIECENFSYANLLTPQGSTNLTLNQINSTTYEGELINVFHLNELGRYNLTIFCNQSYSTSFYVSKLESEASASDVYEGESAKIYVRIFKDNGSGREVLSTQPEISLYENGEEIKNFGKFWNGSATILRLFLGAGNHLIQVKSRVTIPGYNERNLTNEVEVEVKPLLNFDFSILTNYANNWVESRNNLTIRTYASYKGERVYPTRENTKFWVDGKNAEIIKIDGYDVTISFPEESVGKHEVKGEFSSSGLVASKSKDFCIATQISGEIMDKANKPIYMILKFFSNDELVKEIRSNNGRYSDVICPKTYRVDVEFPNFNTRLSLKDASLNTFENLVKYDSFASDIEGMKVSRIHAFEIGMSFSEARVEMSYDESMVKDERNLEVYKCSDWNFAARNCRGSWKVVPAEIDDFHNLVKVTTSDLSAFAIGNRKSLKIGINLNKEFFYLNDSVELSGMVSDETNSPVVNSTIEIEVVGTGMKKETTSSEGGFFSFEFPAPLKEGKYKVRIKASKEPYESSIGEIELDVRRSKEISIEFPSTIKLMVGENSTVELVVKNTGQTDFSEVSITLDGIPKYYEEIPTVESLRSGEEKRLSIFFSVPKNASEATLAGRVVVKTQDYSKDYLFGLTIQKPLAQVINQTILTPTLPTGMILVGISKNLNYLSLALFASASFLFTHALKKRNSKKIKSRKEIENLLLSIKREIRKKKLGGERVEDVKEVIDRVNERLKRLGIEMEKSLTMNKKSGEENE